MPDAATHREQAEHNLRMSDSMDRAAYGDWAATVLFYAALHYVDSFLARTLNYHPSNHADRDKQIHTIHPLRKIRVEYRELKDSSHNARYSPPHRPNQRELNQLRTINVKAVVRIAS